MIPYLKLCLAAVLALLAFACSPAYAETQVGVHVASVHSRRGFNDVNPGVYVRHNGWTLGTYYNSDRYQSYYAGYTAETFLSGGLSLAVTVGAIKYHKWGPLVIPSVGMRNTLIGGRTYISYATKVSDKGAHALHLSHNWSFQ